MESTKSTGVIQIPTVKDHPLAGMTLAFGAKPSRQKQRWAKAKPPLNATTKAGKLSYQLKDGYRLPPIYDQGALGSCVANSAAYLFNYAVLNSAKLGWKKPAWDKPSRLALYYHARYILGIQTNQLYECLMTDTGAYMDDPWEVSARFGIWPETVWPYYTGTFFTPPDLSRAAPWTTLQAASVPCQSGTDVPSLNGMKLQLSSNHTPFSIGIQVYSSFLDADAARTGIIPMPDPERDALLGGHAISIVGYNDSTNRFTFANSWGTSWGNGGYGTIPYDYLTNSTLTFGGDGEPDAYAIVGL